MQFQDATTLSLTLPSTFEALEHVVEVAHEFLVSRRIEEELAYNVVLLLSEAVNNAMEHGNLWEEKKHVTVTVTAGSERVEVSVLDEGEGFDVSMQPCPLEAQNGGVRCSRTEVLARKKRFRGQ